MNTFLDLNLIRTLNKAYRIVCYYTNWSQYRQGAVFLPENIDPYLCSHIIYAYAQIKNGLLATRESNDEDLYKRVLNWKNSNPNLKVLLAVDGKISKLKLI